MLRSSLIAIGVGLLCGETLAQNARTGLPIPVTPKDGGTLDWATGTWKRGAGATFANAPGSNVIYDNRCTWTGGAFYIGNANCWTQYEEGRLPTTDNSDPFLATPTLDSTQLCDCYFLCGFQFGYCSDEVTPAQGGTGQVGIQIGFLEGPNVSGIGGDCMDAAGAIGSPVPPTGAPSNLGIPPANFGGPNDLFVDFAGAGLPGAFANGNTNCWVITLDLSNNANGGFAFCGNGGDSTFEGDGTDFFNLLYGLVGTTEQGPNATGFFQAAEPIKAAPGAGAFGIPAGIDPLQNNAPCGTGLGAQDHSWLNVDANPVGSANTAACPAVSAGGALPAGSACYILGTGWPNAPYGDTYMVMWANSATCASGGPMSSLTNYCTAKASSGGCLAAMGGSSTGPVVSGANDFSVTCTGMQANRPGIFFGSNTAAAAINFQGGFLCVQPPTKRSPVLFSGGTNLTCTGSFTLLINNGALFPPPVIGSGFDAGPGGTSFMQAWYRDPALMDGFDTALSNGVQIDWQ